MIRLIATAIALALLLEPTPAGHSTWVLGETTDLRSWYWGEVQIAPVVEGGQFTCVDNGAGGLRCVIVSQGVYRRLVVDGVTLEDRRQIHYLPGVLNGR